MTDSGFDIPRERVPAVDLAWRRMDDPTNLTIINGVLWFDEPLDVERFKKTLEERLLVIPRFRQRLVHDGTRGHWEPDPDFDLDFHVRHEELEGDDGERALRDRVSEHMSDPLDPDRPLWLFYILDNYHGGSALLGRFHHCVGDGLALMMVLLSLTDLHSDDRAEEEREENPLTALFHRAREVADRVRERAEEEVRERVEDARERLQGARERVEAVLPEAMKLLLKPAEMLESTSRWLKGLGSVQALGRLTFRPPDPKTPLKGPLGEEKRVAWSRGLPMEEIQELRRGLGGTLNDVLMTAVTGGLRRYLAQRGETRDRLSFRALVPVSIRPLEEMSNLGNRFGLVLLSLPVGISDPLERLEELRRRFRKLHRSMEPMVAYKILSAMGQSPRGIQRLVMRFFTAKATAVMTSVPGPRQVLYMAGRAVRGMMFWVPHPGALALGLSILSYAGEVRLGVAVDSGLVPDPEKIIDGFHEELEEMERRNGLEGAPRTA
jgi:diacylglycerol O-acyltransferase